MKTTAILVKAIFMLVILTALLPSCMRYKNVQFKGVEKLKIGKIGMNETTIEMNLLFKNPNKMGAQLNNAKGKAWLDNVYIGDFLLQGESIKIPAKSNFSVPISLSVNINDLLKNAGSILFKDSVSIQLDGAANLSKGSLKKTFPLTYFGKKSSEEILDALDDITQ
ncbi:MAG: hypothetical protein ACK5NK_11355 [Niabella sp.]